MLVRCRRGRIIERGCEEWRPYTIAGFRLENSNSKSVVEPMWKHYYSVTSRGEALSLLSEHAGRARIIAGGTDILIELERGQRPGIDTLIDLSRVPGQDTIAANGDFIRLGAL